MVRPLLLALNLLLLTACSGDDSATTAAEPSPELAAGEAIVKGTCFVCHGQGINGAPIIGNGKMWGARVAQGEDVLVAHAMGGYGLMPAKGGNDELAEEDIRLAVRYMLSRLTVSP